MSGLAAINALDADAVAARLSGAPHEVAAFIGEAAAAGSAEAQAAYAQLLLDGRGVACDRQAAFRWFGLAARQGHVEAINMVGRCHDLGWGVPIDKAAAAKAFRRAAEAGLHWGMYNWATALALGAGVAEDRVAALGWFERAAALGNAKAMNFIGSFHEDGWVVRRDLGEAARWYAQAAEGCDFRGQFNHGRMLLAAGRGAEAQRWFDAAVAGGNDRFRAQAEAWLAANA